MSGFASLCVLSYERPAFLEEALADIFAWSGYPFELIIHDDGSGLEFEIERTLDRALLGGATVIRNKPGHNQGQGVALNRMFHMAQGDPIVKLDQDLRFVPGWLSAAVERLESNPMLGLLGLLHYEHDPVDHRKTEIVPDLDRLVPAGIGVRWHTHILGSGFVVPRSAWEALGPFEQHSEAFAEDYVFQQRVTNSPAFHCGLPVNDAGEPDDLAINRRMGIGPSTIVNQGGRITPIHKGPVILL